MHRGDAQSLQDHVRGEWWGRSFRGDLDSLGVPSRLDIPGVMKLFGRLSKVKQAEFGC
jgi:hypothetical protein